MSLLDLSGVEENNNVLPEGTYSVMVEKAELVPTKTGGEMIKIQYKVIEGKGTGRSVFAQYNIKNANPEAAQIGLGQLKTMMKAFGHPNPNKLETTQELVGLKGVVSVKIEEDKGYGEQNRIKSYKPYLTPQASAAPNANPFG